MESQLEEQPLQEHELYNYAAHLLIKEHKSEEEANAVLVSKGVAPERAREAIEGLQSEIIQAKKEAAHKDMLYGAMWCVGGVLATAADFGYIFWGAILFGGIQFFKGLFNQ